MAFSLICLFLLSDESLCLIGLLPLSSEELQYFFLSLELGVRYHPLQLPVTLCMSVARQVTYSPLSAPLTIVLKQDFKITAYIYLLCSILFYSILFYSILFYSILFYSILFYSILFYSILFYSLS